MKTKLFFLLLIFLNFTLLSAQNTAPEVTNVIFNQRTDGSFMVDIYYDVNDADGDVVSVSMQVSDDAGATWGFSCQQITGDVGSDIASGTNKHIVWDFGAEHPKTFSDQIQIKIIADDKYSGYETGTMTDIDGNVYKTVKIGAQWWMAENLKVTHYRNGDTIPHVTSNSEWQGLSTGARCAYNNYDANIATYGLLYNWYAVDDSRNIAPTGWHVPTDEEWQILVDYLGGYSVAGGKMKETGTIHWNSPNTGATNESGFTALPGGYRSDSDGAFHSMGYFSDWWSATAYGSSYAWYRGLFYGNSLVDRGYTNKLHGYSLRCIRD